MLLYFIVPDKRHTLGFLGFFFFLLLFNTKMFMALSGIGQIPLLTAVLIL